MKGYIGQGMKTGQNFDAPSGYSTPPKPFYVHQPKNSKLFVHFCIFMVISFRSNVD